MDNLITRHRELTVLAVVLIVQVLGLAVQVKSTNDPQHPLLLRYWAVSAITPFERVIVHSRDDVYDVWHNYLYLRGVRQENRDLKEQIKNLKLEGARLEEDANQGHRLQALFAFKEQSVLQPLAAQVIGSSGSEQSRSVFLDKGENDGIKKDMAVITADGVVGKVLTVYPRTAQVLLINDQSSGLGAMVERLRLQGVVRGSAAGETILDKIMPGEEVQAGDKVITTGGDGIFPKGLPVGYVVKVSQADIFLRVRIHPSANLNRLEEVLVVTKLHDEVPSGNEAAGAQRAADILAARLPGVPEKAPEKAPDKTPAKEPAKESATVHQAKAVSATKPVGSPASSAPQHAQQPPNAANKPETKPASAKPILPKPVTSSKPAVLKPVSSTGQVAQNVIAEPTTAKKIDAKPISTRLTNAKPTDVKPTDVKPTNVKPTNVKQISDGTQ